MQNDIDEQETPMRKEAGGSGVSWTVQMLPSQASAKVLPAEDNPTATQVPEPMQLTAERVDCAGPDGSGVDCTDHPLPFHASASVSPM
jgi:hypothetical protein